MIGMFLIILLTGLFFLRPHEWVPGLLGARLFLAAIVPTAIIFVRNWTRELSPTYLSRYPINGCVLGILGVTAISDLVNNGSLDNAFSFFKICIYYALLVGILDSKEKLRTFLWALAAIICGMAILILLDHAGLIGGRQEVGLILEKQSLYARLSRAGALSISFGDPNDTALILVSGILIVLHLLVVTRAWSIRIPLISLIVLLASAMQMTQSRGGFLSLLVGVGVYFSLRWKKRGMVVAGILLPIITVVFATTRMTTFSVALHEGTGKNRLEFWTAALSMFAGNPILGVGPGGFYMRVGRAAHNSFLQAFAELGFVGGMLFLGAFLFGLMSLYRSGKSWQDRVDLAACSNLAQFDSDQPSRVSESTQNLASALLISYAAGILALNHLYSANTYLILAIATVAVRTSGNSNPTPLLRVATGFALAGIIFIAACHFGARFLLGW